MMLEYWGYNPKKNKYEQCESEPFSLFPTVLRLSDKMVYCRRCHRWEYIISFKQNLLKSSCGAVYEGPFVREDSEIDYSYEIQKKADAYVVNIKSQSTVINKRRLYENSYLIDTKRKLLYKNGAPIQENFNFITKEVTEKLIADMGYEYKKEFGIIPTIASSLKGFNLIFGYLCSPFNVNFYKISNHWGLNPCDKDFCERSSGNKPSAENDMFESLNIKPTKFIRKMYQKEPYSVICYAAAKDLGFTDINILQRSIFPEFYDFLFINMFSCANGNINYGGREDFRLFVEDMLKLTSEKVVWHSLERSIKNPDGDILLNFIGLTNNYSLMLDIIHTYASCHNVLSDREKRMILEEGFTTYTHDFLVNKANNNKSENSKKALRFEIKPQYKLLEYKAGDSKRSVVNPITRQRDIEDVPDEDRFCFYVADSERVLTKIGTEMNNCVGFAYSHKAASGDCAIVYAKHKGKYKICIEVSPALTVRQVYGPCNSYLRGEALEAYQEWCKEKHIQSTKVL